MSDHKTCSVCGVADANVIKRDDVVGGFGHSSLYQDCWRAKERENAALRARVAELESEPLMLSLIKEKMARISAEQQVAALRGAIEVKDGAIRAALAGGSYGPLSMELINQLQAALAQKVEKA